MSLSNASYQTKDEIQTPMQGAGGEPVPAWKMELNAKLAAHRQRRPALAEAPGNAPRGERQRPEDGGGRAAMVAARVAERYAKAPSYSEFLAASAAAAVAAAETAALAARQAQATAEVMARFAEASERESCWVGEPEEIEKALAARPELHLPGPGTSCRVAAVEVEHPQPLPPRGVLPPRGSGQDSGLDSSMGGIVDAFAEATVPAAIGLPAKLIEFPRELIAARKSRPRIAEGPLAEEALAFEEPLALRIFEVGCEPAGSAGSQQGEEVGEREWEASIGLPHGPASERAEKTCEHLEDPALTQQQGHGVHRDQSGPLSSIEDARSSYSPHAGDVGRQSEERRRTDSAWQPIRLGAHPHSERTADDGAAVSAGEPANKLLLHTASLGDRAMAALVDGAVVTAAFLVFVLVFAACTAHPPMSKAAFVAAAAVFAGVFLFYQWLFLSYGGGTLGMRYARIALCTFEDENPTRRVLQRRVMASVLSALPLGLGFVWTIFDEDGLGWHDRMTRSYQRSYR